MHLGSLSSENTLVSIQMCTTLLPPNFQLLYLQIFSNLFIHSFFLFQTRRSCSTQVPDVEHPQRYVVTGNLVLQAVRQAVPLTKSTYHPPLGRRR